MQKKVLRMSDYPRHAPKQKQEPLSQEYKSFRDSLPTGIHKRLLELYFGLYKEFYKKMLYESSFEKMLEDIENRMAGRTYVFEFNFAPPEDIHSAAKDLKNRLDEYKKKHGKELSPYQTIKPDFKPKPKNQFCESLECIAERA